MTIFPRAVRRALPLALASSFILASCGGGGDIDNELAFRVIHASPDSPPVNILVDGITFRSGVDYKGGTGFTFVTPRDYQFGIEAILPGEDALVIDETVPLAAGTEITVLAIGKDATNTVQSLIIQNPFADIPAGNTRLQLVHAAPDLPPVDIYLTAQGASLQDATPIGQVTYGAYPADRQLVPPGQYVLRVTPAGDPATVLFDSGLLPDLSNREDLLIVVVQNTAAGPSPVSLIVNDRFSTFEAVDKDTPAEVRVVNVSPDAPSLDVIGDPVSTSFPEIPFSSTGNLSGIAVDSANGRALVVDNGLAAVVAVDLQSGVRTVLSGSAVPDTLNPLLGPAGIAVDSANGRALVADKSQGALLAVDLQTGARTVLSNSFTPDTVNRLFGPVSLAVDSANGRALVVDNAQRAVLAVDLQTGARTFLSNSATPDAVNAFSGPAGIVLDTANGRALVADNRLDSLLAVNLQTGGRTILSNVVVPDAVNPFSSPVSLALDTANGRALVVDNRSAAMFAVNLQTGARTILSNATTPDAVNPFSGPSGVAIDDANSRALVVDNRQGAVVAVNLQTGARSILSASPSANGVAFLGTTDYVRVLPDSYAVRAEKTAAPNSASPLFTVSSNLFTGQRATVFTNGLLASLVGQVAIDGIRPVFAEGKLRFLHGAPAAGTVDLYVLETGTAIADVEPTFQNLILTSITSHLGFAPANYTITFTKADTKEVVAAQDVAATPGTAHTVILVDEVRVDASSDGKPASVLVLDDLAD